MGILVLAARVLLYPGSEFRHEHDVPHRPGETKWRNPDGSVFYQVDAVGPDGQVVIGRADYPALAWVFAVRAARQATREA